jgi:hypothetical protein
MHIETKKLSYYQSPLSFKGYELERESKSWKMKDGGEVGELEKLRQL